MSWFKSAFIAAMSVFMPIKAMLVTVIVLVLADLATGVWAAYKMQQPITSAKMRNTVSKLLIYLVAVCVGFLVENYLLEQLLPVSKLIAGAIGMVELTSLLENANKILGTDIFKAILLKLGSANAEKIVEGEVKNGP